MASVLKVGQVLRGKVGRYTVTQEIHKSIWMAVDGTQRNVVIKTSPKMRLYNERDVLKLFQERAPSLRPLIDEIQDPLDPPSIVLKYLDQKLQDASNQERLTRPDIKFVARRVLEALQVLHEGGYTHTDVKPDNIMVNRAKGGLRFSDVQLADFGEASHIDSSHAQDGELAGTGIFRSPEMTLEIPWNSAADIWSLGTTASALISLIWGENWHIFRPDGLGDDDDPYEVKILLKNRQFFGLFPPSYGTIADDDRLAILTYVNNSVPPEDEKPFYLASSKEITAADRAFICKIMKLDPRDRPTAKQLLADEWFQVD